jgi:transcriptional regulator with XRE-family HTH domain
MPAGMTRTVLTPKMGENGRTVLETTRILKGFTLTELALRSGVSKDALWRFEQPTTKSRRPRPNTAKKIADALGCAVEALFTPVTL